MLSQPDHESLSNELAMVINGKCSSYTRGKDGGEIEGVSEHPCSGGIDKKSSREKEKEKRKKKKKN